MSSPAARRSRWRSSTILSFTITFAGERGRRAMAQPPDPAAAPRRPDGKQHMPWPRHLRDSGRRAAGGSGHVAHARPDRLPGVRAPSKESVSGLQPQAAVRYKGVAVGRCAPSALTRRPWAVCADPHRREHRRAHSRHHLRHPGLGRDRPGPYPAGRRRCAAAAARAFGASGPAAPAAAELAAEPAGRAGPPSWARCRT